MSTRSGRVVTLIEVLNEAVKMAKESIEQKNPSLEDKEEIAKKIGIGAVIFNDLKNHRSLDYEFNLESMLKFEGQTGPYIQYTGVRIASILRENSIDANNIKEELFELPHYYAVIKNIDNFGNVIIKAMEENAPSVIAKYLLSLAQEFNTFYGIEKIVSQDLATRNTNLLLIKAVKIVIEEGLRLIGLDSLERM